MFDSSTTIARSGISAPITSAADAEVSAPVGNCGRDAAATGAVVPGASSSANAIKAHRGTAVFGEHVHLAAGRHQVAGHARVGEERDRRLGAGQHQMLGAVQLGRGGLGEVRQPLDGGDTGAAFQPRRECLAQQPGAGRLGDPRGRGQTRRRGWRRRRS